MCSHFCGSTFPREVKVVTYYPGHSQVKCLLGSSEPFFFSRCLIKLDKGFKKPESGFAVRRLADLPRTAVYHTFFQIFHKVNISQSFSRLQIFPVLEIFIRQRQSRRCNRRACGISCKELLRLHIDKLSQLTIFFKEPDKCICLTCNTLLHLLQKLCLL